MAFQQGLSGLNAASQDLDVVGNNIANAGTVGFKQSATQFADVFAASLSGAGGVQIGIGTKVGSVNQQFTQGNITVSNNPLDIAINGGGFFRLSGGGTISYSRDGQFQLDKSGFISTADGHRLTGYVANSAGVLNTATPTDLQMSTSDLMPNVTAKTTMLLNLDSRTTAIASAFSLTDPTTYNSSTSAAVYDSLGNPHTFTTYFTKTAANTWKVYSALDGTQIGAGATGTIYFKSDGSIDTSAGKTVLPFNISAAVATGATTPLAYTLDFTGTTQFGSSFSVNAITQDGYASGRLSGFNVGSDGVIVARYTNGQTSKLGQVVLANFANAQGLQPLGNSVWAETSSSGSALVGVPNSGSLGVLQSGSREDSNVDLTAELVKMITAQRVYQANAQSIKTQDQVLQTLVNLR